MRFAVTVVIAAGGAIGATARYLLLLAWPFPTTAAGGFPWATALANVLGCLLIGALMVLILDVWVGHRLLRPFLGIGVLGGFTTYSTYALDALTLVEQGRAVLAIGYVLGTVLAALAAVWLGAHLMRAAVATHRRPGATGTGTGPTR